MSRSLHPSRSHGIAVFGAGGFIGRTVSRTFEELGFELSRITSQDADLSDAAQTASLRLSYPPGATWVLAAARNPGYGGDIKATNLAIAESLANLAKAGPPSGIVLFSSIDVYGRSGLTLPLHEDSPRNPQSDYAESKCLTEDLLAACCEELDVPLLTLRLPGVYGPGDTPRGPVRRFIEAALRGTPIQVDGDGEQLRDLLYVDDLPGIIAAWMTSPSTLVSNAVTGRSVSLNQMIDVVRECAGREIPVHYEANAPQFDLTFSRPKILQRYPAYRLTPVEDGIRETWHGVRAALEDAGANVA